MAEKHKDEVSVFVTGFGPFLNIQTNPSASIVSLLPTTINLPTIPRPICLLTLPSPLPCAYHQILSTITTNLNEHNPDIVIHIGLAVERDYFAIELGAERDGYHEFPDEERKVFIKAEGKKIWGKSPARLDSSIDCEDVLIRWRGNIDKKRGKGKGRGKKEKEKEVDLRISGDVGNYVCGFAYYTSLEWFWGKERERKVLFLHIPGLEGEEEVQKGREVVEALIGAVVESCGL